MAKHTNCTSALHCNKFSRVRSLQQIVLAWNPRNQNRHGTSMINFLFAYCLRTLADCKTACRNILKFYDVWNTVLWLVAACEGLDSRTRACTSPSIPGSCAVIEQSGSATSHGYRRTLMLGWNALGSWQQPRSCEFSGSCDRECTGVPIKYVMHTIATCHCYSTVSVDTSCTLSAICSGASINSSGCN